MPGISAVQGSCALRSLLLGGKPDAALAELAQAFRAGEYAAWWYTIESDPLWLPLHNDSRFRSIAADVRRYIDAQRSELEALAQRPCSATWRGSGFALSRNDSNSAVCKASGVLNPGSSPSNGRFGRTGARLQAPS